MTKWVYTFGDGAAEGRASDTNLLGGKGANLAEMCQPRPAGAAGLHHHHGSLQLVSMPTARPIRPELEGAGRRPLSPRSGRIAGRRFGDPETLLLVSVRSGARASMPGMMDTVLNLGLNDDTVEALAEEFGRCALRL